MFDGKVEDLVLPGLLDKECPNPPRDKRTITNEDRKEFNACKGKESNRVTERPLNVAQTRVVFFVLMIGLGLSLITFLGEKVWGKAFNKNK